MTENKKLVATRLDVPKINLQENIDVDPTEITQKIYDEALNNLVKSLREMDAEASDEVLRAFAITYFNLEFTNEYDVRSRTYKVMCTPVWKDINEVNTNSKEFKLLHDYAMEQL